MTEHPLLRLTIKAAAAIAADRFVEVDGSLPAAGGHALGVTYSKAKSGEQVAVATLGVVQATAGAAITKGAALQVTTTGKVITATANKVSVARALEAATTEGDLIKVHLIAN